MLNRSTRSKKLNALWLRVGRHVRSGRERKIPWLRELLVQATGAFPLFNVRVG